MKTLKATIAAAFALSLYGSAVSQESNETLVQCGTSQIQLALQNNLQAAPRITFRGITNDERLVQKLSELEGRASQIAVLACSENAEAARTTFLLSILSTNPDGNFGDEKDQAFGRVTTVFLRFVGDRPHSYLEVEPTEEGPPIRLLPEYGLLTGDLRPSFEIGDFVDVSNDSAFFSDNLGVQINPVVAD